MPRSREEALAADAADPIAGLRQRWVVSDDAPIYLDGNSLGRPARDTAERVNALLARWAVDLVGGWDDWIDFPRRVGDRIGRLVGAAPGQVVMSDSTTVDLFKLAAAALDRSSGAVVADGCDFPTVRYVLQGLGRPVRWLDGDPAEGVAASDVGALLDGGAALVCLSAVNFRSGAVADIPGITRLAHDAGALVLWDCSHAAGAVPVDLDRAGADLAVGCSYKYLNGGPGAPAWLYVRRELQERLRQPIWGWWGQREQFAMGEQYQPAPGVDRYQTGTPAVLGLVAVDAGIDPLLAAGMPALWAKARSLVALLAARVEARLVPLGARLASPSDPARRGAHLAVAHPHALGATRMLVERRLVVPDFRPPDLIRLAPVAGYTRYVEVWDAVESIAEVLSHPAVADPVAPRRVT